jgi:molybdate transport system substrate-binding protein
VSRSTLSGALVGLVAALGCGGDSGEAKAAARTELVVYAATSTRDVLELLEGPYEREHSVDLVFNFGSSGALAKQIVAAAKADVFLSADEKEMDEVERAKHVAEGTRRDLLSNQLVVIEPAEGISEFTEPFDPSQLAGKSVKRLSLADVNTVPAGRYAKAWLETRGVWAGVADRVLPGVDARATLAAVESGGAQAGIVYRTEAARSDKVRVVFAVPREEGPPISYPVAVIAGRPADAEARAFAGFLASPNVGKAFEEHGFVFLPAGKASGK